MLEEEYIKLIFGLKLKQIRTEKELSLFGLSKKSGLSKSYLNEIEKGKKYPKTDKIIAVAEALEVSYDELVSLKLDRNLAPVGELLQSNILKEIPLDHFGIKKDDLIGIIADAPLKVNTFINTLIEIAKYYNLNKENFYLVALRSFQESHNNYFPEIEEKAKVFFKEYLSYVEKPSVDDLKEVLAEEYNYVFEKLNVEEASTLSELRSIYSPKHKKLFLSEQMDEAQLLFVLAKEIGYNYLQLKERPLTFSWIKYDSFEEVLNNFYASYFAGALLISEKKLVTKINKLISKNEFDFGYLKKMIQDFSVSTETFFQRLTNVLPGKFGIRNLFFLRFTSEAEKLSIKLTKELHITNLHEPHAKKSYEHYCRKWISSKLIERFCQVNDPFLIDAQISVYPSNKSYFVVASSSKDPFKKNKIRSIGLGILMNSQNAKQIKFLKDSQLVKEMVGVTCETCLQENCDKRIAEPKWILQEKYYEQMANEVEIFMNKLKEN